MFTRIPLLAVLLIAFGCSPPKQTVLSAPTATEPSRSPSIEQLGDRWYITGLDPISTQIVARSSLFAAVHPQHGRVAVLKVLDRGLMGSDRLEVALVCQSLKVAPSDALLGLGVEPLSPTGDARVDQCLVRIVDESRGPDRPNYVLLNVGGGEQIKPGDEYALLGEPICQDGFVPLGLDTARDGRCVIAPSVGPMKTVSRCDIVKQPAGDEGSLKRRYALFVARE